MVEEIVRLIKVDVPPTERVPPRVAVGSERQVPADAPRSRSGGLGRPSAHGPRHGRGVVPGADARELEHARDEGLTQRIYDDGARLHVDVTGRIVYLTA